MKKEQKTTELRSKIMRSVKSKNTSTEILVRLILRELGIHYRLHRKDLPSKPDIVIPKYKTVIFVNGCFWHGHNCKKGRLPKTNVDFWKTKIKNNKHRDKRAHKELEKLGWTTLVIWQCETKDLFLLKNFLIDSLNLNQ
jgi:DNA mismatch endonuclease, patch repair protein